MAVPGPAAVSWGGEGGRVTPWRLDGGGQEEELGEAHTQKSETAEKPADKKEKKSFFAKLVTGKGSKQPEQAPAAQEGGVVSRSGGGEGGADVVMYLYNVSTASRVNPPVC